MQANGYQHRNIKSVSQHEQDFQAFYEKYLLFVYRYIYSKIGYREEAEDLTSQVFIKALKAIDYQRDQHSQQKWLLQVARTTIADHWRLHYQLSAHSLEQLLDAGWEGPVEQEPTPASLDPLQHVQQILRALPEHQREVLTCRFLLNLSIKETAQRLSLTETNVKVLQFRALKHAATIDLEYTHIPTKPADKEYPSIPTNDPSETQGYSLQDRK
jgi:RNA polymerase sigma-70 factor (ECF subfamily)